MLWYVRKLVSWKTEGSGAATAVGTSEMLLDSIGPAPSWPGAKDEDAPLFGASCMEKTPRIDRGRSRKQNKLLCVKRFPP